jgi:hypothetical protein
MRFFTDSDREIPVRWYFCDDDAQAFPAPHVFNSANWNSDKGPWTGPGEVYGAPRPWNDGLMPRLLNGAVDDAGNPCARVPLDAASQDPQTGIITFTTDLPHLLRLGQRVYLVDGVPQWAIRGPFTVLGVPSQMQVQVFWPREMQDFPGGDQYLEPLEIWGQFTGQFYFGELADFQGAHFDPSLNSDTNEKGLCLACMPLEPECWLTVIDVTNGSPTGIVPGEILHFTLYSRPEPDHYLLLAWVCDVVYSNNPFYSWQPAFCSFNFAITPFDNGLGLNSGILPPFGTSDNQTADWYTLDQQTFWWLDFNPVRPAGSPTIPDERWYCVLTFYNPLDFVPGAPFTLFPFDFFPPYYWPSAFGL